MKTSDDSTSDLFVPGSLHQLDIVSLAFNGYGVGRKSGKVFFVPFSAPGDRIECRVTRNKKNCIFAEITQVLEAAPERQQAPCPAFGRCGGCHWQYLPYPQQCRWKESIFRDMLQRQAGVAAEVFEPLVLSSEFHYRNRAQFKCRQTDKGFAMGFYRRESHFVIDIPECPLMVPEVNEALQRFRLWIEGTPFSSSIPQIDITADETGKVRVVVHHLGNITASLSEFLGPLAAEAGMGLFFQSGRNHTLRKICGAEDLSLFPLSRKEGMALSFGPGSFSQVNLDQNRRLVKEVLKSAKLSGRERVLDLYCGIGNLTLPLASFAAEVVGVENYSQAVGKARQNAAQNHILNARFYALSAESAALQLGEEKKFDVVILDPPREGAFQAVKQLLKLKPGKIIYVSCNPSTLARDLVPLIHNGYKIVRSMPFDFFPQTFHVESLTVLKLK